MTSPAQVENVPSAELSSALRGYLDHLAGLRYQFRQPFHLARGKQHQ